MHQKKSRRSTTIPPTSLSNVEQFSSSPAESISSEDSRQSANASDIIDVSESDSDSDKDTVREDTVTANVNEDLTGHSESLLDSDPASASSTRLENSLRQAAQHASTYSTQQDETGDVSMELPDQNPSRIVMPEAQQAIAKLLRRNMSSMQDQENVNPFSPAFAAGIQNSRISGNEGEMTMDMTQAVGVIIGPTTKAKQSPERGRRKSLPPSRRRGSVGRRRSSGGSSTLEDETMEFATAYGGIQQPRKTRMDEQESEDEDGEMTMELTTVMGGVVQPSKPNNDQRNETTSKDSPWTADATNMDMDMTTAAGRLLSPVTERTEPSEDGTIGMDITNAVGSILPRDLKTNDKSTAKMLMEEEADHGQLTRSPFPRRACQDHQNPPSLQKAVKATDAGSPEAIKAHTPKSQQRAIPKQHSTPVKTPNTPSKQLTPQPVRPTTPSKTPPSKNISMRRTSPKKLFKVETKRASKSPKSSTPNLKFSKDIKTGQTIPTVVLTPPVRRRISGIGIDQDGIGSPRVAAILDRRTSLLDSAENFTPQKATSVGVRFEDPVAMEQEVDQERAEDERRESGRGILQQESEGAHEDEAKDLTANLKDMIQSLTPKKSRLKGRKSLAGSAKGLLGKRPVELDTEDEEDETPKRLKGKERSPVKNILLPGPLSKDETTGRLGKAPKFALNSISGNVSTPTMELPDQKPASTPKDHERFTDAQIVKIGSSPPTSFNEQLSGMSPEVDLGEEAPISLLEFLNMTNIRFMDLTTTRRRHTVAPSTELKSEEMAHNGSQLADCVLTGACTIPMLDLFQHVSFEMHYKTAKLTDCSHAAN